MARQPLRSNDIRESNEKLVLHLLFEHESVSQSRVVQLTGLKAPTVFRIFENLKEDRLIEPCDCEQPESRARERKGRRPVFFRLNPSSRYALGVDFSTLTASVIAVDFCNRVIYSATRDLPAGAHRDQILTRIESLIDEAIVARGIARESILGIGIASPGLVDTAEGRVVEYARIVGLQGYSLRDHFERRYGVPILVHNNASVIASSAYRYGVGRNEDSLLAVLVRSGVGAALVSHGKIFLNGTATALEVGRTVAAVGGASLEAVVSEPALLTLLRERLSVDSWQDAERALDAQRVGEALHDALAVFATAVYNLYHLLHPEVVLVIARHRLMAEVLANAARAAVHSCRVLPVVYDPVQACYGATDLVFQRFFSNASLETAAPLP